MAPRDTGARTGLLVLRKILADYLSIRVLRRIALRSHLIASVFGATQGGTRCLSSYD